ncbi:LANO_0F12838g1_1 [Lachancea nothofagi CBS 11611]|uniref:LANO_0F12838g1_1 n=1 Tax=Lachancea nothofagi CBS 11611 TaxID=1266666 RepID=A0A1G4KBI0_9SACH|nr:LANO_0F12838g1_1 [Lachancea nothofagi CBS 11611]
MSTYEEEHGTTGSNASDRRDLRSQLHSLYQENGTSNALLQMLSQLIPESMQEELLEDTKDGCPDNYIDSLPRIKKKDLKEQESCSICCCNYKDDEYPLVVELPHCSHRFDLECVAVWLSKSTTCPLCRDDVLSHKPKIDVSQVEMEDEWGMYG